jgi:hypothetical protein
MRYTRSLFDAGRKHGGDRIEDSALVLAFTHTATTANFHESGLLLTTCVQLYSRYCDICDPALLFLGRGVERLTLLCRQTRDTAVPPDTFTDTVHGYLNWTAGHITGLFRRKFH